MEPISEVKFMDRMKYMSQFSDKFFDLASIDPEYGIGEDGESNHSRGTARHAATKFKPKKWDSEPPPPEFFRELIRVSKNQIIFGANHFIERIPNANSSSWIVWDKNNADNDFADAELAWTSFKTAVRVFKFTWNGMLQGDMKHKQKRIHSTQKPIQLYEWILEKYAKPGYKILDTGVGSQSHRIAAYNLGFDFWGCENDEDHFNDGSEWFETVKRIKNEIKDFGFSRSKLTETGKTQLLF